MLQYGVGIATVNRRFHCAAGFYVRVEYNITGSSGITKVHQLKGRFRSGERAAAGVRSVQCKIELYGVGCLGGNCDRDGNFLVAQHELLVVSGVKADAYPAAGRSGADETFDSNGRVCAIRHAGGVFPTYGVSVGRARCGKFYGQVGGPGLHCRQYAHRQQAQRET